MRWLLMFLPLWLCLPTQASPGPVPPIRLQATFEVDELLARIRLQPEFAGLNKDRLGSPILLTVTHSLLPNTSVTGKATDFASAVLTGGTLGLIPIISNHDLVITYDLVVNGSLLGSYRYRRNFTKATNLYSEGGILKLNDDQKAWALSTTAEFTATAKASLDPVLEDYRRYFGVPQPSQQ